MAGRHAPLALLPLRLLPLLLLPLLLVVPIRANDQVCPEATLLGPCQGPRTAEQLMRQVAAKGYDKTERPPCGNGTYTSPTVVEAQFYLVQVHEVNEKLGHVRINGYLRRWWHDPRLVFNSTKQGGCADDINMMGSESDGLWRPDIYIDNLVEMDTEYITRLVAVSSNGRVWQSEQVVMTVRTTFEFGQLPYDSHTCTIVVASYSQDVRFIRLLARGGSIGSGVSGAGLAAAPMTHSVWSFPQQKETRDGSFTTPGFVKTRSSWDYLTLSFQFSRQPKYYVEQTILPAVLFLGVSYIQFWVDPKMAPARACVAVLPVLIMRTLSNSVYSTLPEGSQQVWLLDFINSCVALSVIAAAEFAVVQYLLRREGKRRSMLMGLQQHRGATEKLIKYAMENNVALLSIVDECSAKKVDGIQDADMLLTGNSAQPMDAITPQPSGTISDLGARDGMTAAQSESKHHAPVVQQISSTVSVAGHSRRHSLVAMNTMALGGRKARAVGADKYGVKECDLLFIMYAQRLFRRLTDIDQYGISPGQIRWALKHFDIYMSTEQVATAVCMFLRDHASATPEDESLVRLTFSEFTAFLLRIDNYRLNAVATGTGLRGMVERFRTESPAEAVDTVAQWISPSILGLLALAFYLALPLYHQAEPGEMGG